MAEAGESVQSSFDAQKASPAQRLRRAKGYPYTRPHSSFVWCKGQALTFEDARFTGVHCLPDLPLDKPNLAAGFKEALAECKGDWTAVLGIGSNAAPEQLARKFPEAMFSHAVIPVVRCVLQDYDVCAAPLIAGYGSCTATLEYSKGTSVEVWITYLQPDLLMRMHNTEGSYDLMRLMDISLSVGTSLSAHSAGISPGLEVDSVLLYIATNGTLHTSAAEPPGCVALADIPAAGRRFCAKSQAQLLALLQSQLCRVADASQPDNGLELTLDDWIMRNLQHLEWRQRYTAIMVSWAKPFAGPKYEVMQTLGHVVTHVE